MNEDLYISLIYQKLQGTISEEATQQLESWLSDAPENRALEAEIAAIYELSDDYGMEEIEAVDVDAAFATQLELIGETSSIQKEAVPKRQGRIISLYRIAAAAAILLLLVWVGTSFLGSDTIEMVATTATYEKEKVVLADGTTVWLRKGSEIKYSNDFNDGHRNVELNGEAMFEVSESDVPFIVHTSIGRVKVLGTIFNLKYKDDQELLDLSVVEGKVNISLANSNQNTNVVAGERVVGLYNSKKLNKITTPSENVTAWYSKKINFKATPLTEVIQTLENYYDVDITLKNSTLKTCPFTSTFEDKELDFVLNTINEVFGTVQREEKQGKYMLEGGTCEE